MIELCVVTPYTGNGADVDYTGLVCSSYPSYKTLDLTNAPTENMSDENLLTVAMFVDDAVFTNIANDNRFFVVWDRPNPRNPNDIPSASEFGQLRAYMARNGVSNAVFIATFGHGPNGRTRYQIGEELSTWLATRPKAKAK